jgi:ubiquinone biosynthesis protein
LDAAGIDRDELARRFLRAIIKQVLIDGFFHADPHPGNVLVDTSDGTIVFIDLGLVGQLTVEQRTDLLDLLASIQSKDSKSIAAVAMRMCTHSRPVDEQAVFRAVDRIVYQYLIYGGGGADLGQAISGILGSLYDLGLRMDQDFTLAIKAIIQAEEITTTLAPSFDLIEQGVADARDLILTEFTAEKIVDQVKSAAIATGKEVLRRVPSLQGATLSWLDQYQKGKLVVEVDTTDLNREVGKFAAMGGQLAAAAIVAGAVIGAGIVVAALIFAGPTEGTILPAVLVLVFVGLVLVGVVMAWRMFRGASAGPDSPR